MLQWWQITAAEMMFHGKTNEEIIDVCWPNANTDGKRAGKRRILKKLCEDETFMEYYRSIIKEWTMHSVGPALNKLRSQVDSDKEWLANKAANDVINQSKLVITGADDNTMVVKVEGMPELGEPDE
jgi:hypothetical protein